MKIDIKKIVIPALIATVSGCTVGPDYKAPARSDTDFTADIRKDKATLAENQDPNAVTQWWSNFNDETLTALIDETLKGNFDIKIAQQRLDQSRAALGMSKADYLPNLNATGSYTRTRSSEATGIGGIYNRHSAGFDAGWELDIFGGVRRSVESATASLEATEFALEDVWVTLAAEVAVNYVDLRMVQEQLRVAQDNLKAQQETLDLLESRYKAGLGNELAVQQARYTTEMTRSSIPELNAAIEAYENILAVLTGVMPGNLHARLANPSAIPSASESLIINIPADILRQRPDVRRAERQLAAQYARIGVATSDLYPKLALSGSVGLEALRIDRMTDPGMNYYSVGPSFRWNIFDANRVRNNIKVQDAMAQEYLAAYEKTVLSAAAEVRNTLVAWQQQQDKLKSITTAETAALAALDLAKNQYSNGLTDFNNVLDAQRAVLSMQAQKVSCRGAISTELIRLYKSIAGNTIRN